MQVYNPYYMIDIDRVAMPVKVAMQLVREY